MLSSSLWGTDFEIQDNTEEILDKIKSPKQLTVAKKASSKLSLEDRLLVVEQEVNKILGKHKEDTLVIKSKEDFSQYITAAISDGYIAVDTETNNSTDPLTCKLMGLCLYSKNQKQAYIPVNHIDLNTNERLSWQITEKDIKEELQRLIDNNVKVIYHNAAFDIRVIQCTCGIELLPYWDTMIASKVLNNLEDKGLKTQYILHIDSEHGKYSIETLFDKQPYEIFSPDLFALYAATDAFMTYKLYEYQLNQFNKKENYKLFKLFFEVEMPLIKVVKNMMLRGLTIDIEYWKRLKAKYDTQLTEIDNSLNNELNLLKNKIDSWKLTKEATYKEKKVLESGKESFTKSKAEQLENPINLSSSTQLSILFYDILKLEQVNKKKPRSTDEDTLKLLYEKTKLPICELLLERRGIVKLLSTYIDNIPELLEVWKDGKIRSGFSQYGTDTGRFTSGGKIKFMVNGKRKEVSLVNLQTIPSHNKEIRIEYCASPGYKIVGGDYSSQEPRLTAFMSKDEKMLNAYKEGKDLYAFIASFAFNKSYEACLEFHPVTHEKQVEGKERRAAAKTIMLGITYGMGISAIAEKLGKTKEEAESILNKFYKSFPAVKKWTEEVDKNAKQNGYVEDWYGRRRQLPDIKLPEYTITPINNTCTLFNPFLECENRIDDKLNKKIKKYFNELSEVKWNSQFKDIQAKGLAEGLDIRSNSMKIADAERQSVNAIIQGGAATLTKLAMVNIENDEELNRLGFRLLATIHDEVFGECPEENADECAKRLSDVMIKTAEPYMDVPMKVDTYCEKNWYTSEMGPAIKEEYSKYLEKYKDKEKALDNVILAHPELLSENIKKVILLDENLVI